MSASELDERNKMLAQWDRDHVWHGFTQMAEYQPLIIERAQGCRLLDVNGREYIDGVSSLWCNVHGHRHPKLDAAVKQQLARVAHVTSLGLSNPTTICLAKSLVDLSPGELNHVFFSDSGATAIEAALKMALQYWQQCERPQPEKTRYVALEHAYHGDTVGSVSVGGVVAFHQQFAPLLFEPFRVPSPDLYRLPEGVTQESACEYYLGLVEDVLVEHREQIAALIMEPLVQGAAGMIMHPQGYLRGVRDLTRKYDVLLIADEVAVGMGRTGKMFACEHEAVTPDLMCLAKGLSGGYLPVAATLTTSAIWDAFLGAHADQRTFFHGHTFGGNPLGCAVALASLSVFAEEDTLGQLPAKIELLETHLQRISKLPHVGDVRQCGMMAGIELVKEVDTKEPFAWADRVGDQVCRAAIEMGVWIRPLGNVVVLMPPLAISMEELDVICEVTHGSIAKLPTVH